MNRRNFLRASGKLLMGKSAWDIEGHWTQMYTTEFNTLGGTLFAAMSAIDVALWDIVGKKLGVPVYKLLGATGHLPSWNFGKYVVGKDGKVRAFFPSDVTPDEPALRAAIADALKAN